MSHPLAGSISTGTLRPQDLIPRFFDTLAVVDPTAHNTLNPDVHVALNQLDADEYTDVDDLLASLIDALDDAAPEGYRFGAHEGDGADFGFWEVDGE